MKVIVLAKSPVAGQVKTRLCPPLTGSQAAAVAAASLADTLTAVCACGVDERVLVLDGAPGDWLPYGFRVISQRGGTLTERLTAAWHDVGGPAVQIGMDTPQLTAPLLDLAAATLSAGAKAVLGPATDGGWWALGLHRPDERLFRGIPTSTRHTGGLQAERLAELGLGPVLLPALRDVDTWADAVAVAADGAGDTFRSTVHGLVRLLARETPG